MDCHDTYPVFLHGHVGQVNVHVVQLLDARVVLDGAEPAESQLEHVGLERSERGDQDVEPQVELLTPDQQRIVDVPAFYNATPFITILNKLVYLSDTCNFHLPRNDVALFGQVGVEGVPRLSGPLFELA